MFAPIIDTFQRVDTSAPVITTQMRPEHLDGVARLSAPEGADDEYFSRSNLLQALRRYPEGQLVGLLNGQVVSYAITLRTHRTPTDEPLSWMDVIGDLTLRNHDPNGDWLYGVDFAVDTTYRRMGIGTKMYAARFNLVKRLNLRGFYAGGMLMGYDRYRHQMSPREYGEKVMRGELTDPTVTMQIHRGFKPRAVIEGYVYQPEAGSAAVLIEWQNPQYKPVNLPLLNKLPDFNPVVKARAATA
jgi:ribosomal protein S18 acetylase RimI-like enzyme